MKPWRGNIIEDSDEAEFLCDGCCIIRTDAVFESTRDWLAEMDTVSPGVRDEKVVRRNWMRQTTASDLVDVTYVGDGLNNTGTMRLSIFCAKGRDVFVDAERYHWLVGVTGADGAKHAFSYAPDEEPNDGPVVLCLGGRPVALVMPIRVPPAGGEGA